MKQFNGFPTKMEFTPLPNLFFSSLLPQIGDMAELKITLHVLAILYRKRGFPRFVAFREMLGNASLMSSLKGSAEPPDEVLRQALKMATERGTLIHVVLDRNGASEDVYFLNTESNRQAAVKIQSGELKLSGLKVKEQAYVEPEEQPNIFKLYEDNIGMLDPMIAEQLRDAEKVYPQDWIRDAIKEAVNQNIHKWSYISAILERWSVEGKSDGTYQRDSKKTDPDRFIKGKYGHLVRRR
jgi:DnaD/phage-associated family protein